MEYPRGGTVLFGELKKVRESLAGELCAPSAFPVSMFSEKGKEENHRSLLTMKKDCSCP